MIMYFILGIMLSVTFSFSLAVYLSKYTFQLTNKSAYVVAVPLGLVLSVMVISLGIFAVWPPILPL